MCTNQGAIAKTYMRQMTVDNDDTDTNNYDSYRTHCALLRINLSIDTTSNDAHAIFLRKCTLVRFASRFHTARICNSYKTVKKTFAYTMRYTLLIHNQHMNACRDGNTADVIRSIRRKFRYCQRQRSRKVH